MNGASCAGQAQLGGSTVWKVVGTGDFNSDGKPDIMWQHPTSGELWAWIMNGATVTQSTLLSGGTVWSAIGAR